MTWTWQMSYALAAPAFALLAAGCVWLSDVLFDRIELRKKERRLRERREALAGSGADFAGDGIGVSQSYHATARFAEGHGGTPDA